MQKIKNALVASAVAALICPFAVNAGTMGDVNVMGENGKFLLIEGGFDYMNALYLNNVTGAQSVTLTNPNGVSYNPSNVLPNNFVGGYMGLSFFLNSWLLNTRYDMYAKNSKQSDNGLVFSDIAPAKLSFTLDKTWSAAKFIYGLGAGVVLSTQNEAQIFTYDPATLAVNGGQIGFAFPGRGRLDPLVEAVGMYRLSNNFNLRGNVAYQIPEHSFYTNGHINVNVGVNYAIPL